MILSKSLLDAYARGFLAGFAVFICLFSIAAGLYLVLRQPARERSELLMYSGTLRAVEGVREHDPQALRQAQEQGLEALGLSPFDKDLWRRFADIAQASGSPLAAQARVIGNSLAKGDGR